MAAFTRRQVLGMTATATGSLALPGLARATSSPSEADLATYRLLLGTELLGIAFYRRAAASRLFPASRRRDFAQALRNEQQHLAAVGGLLADAGQSVPSTDDFDIVLPARAFASRLRTAELGIELETAFLGGYLGAAGSLGDPQTAAVAARIAAGQARNLALHHTIADDRPVGPAFPLALEEEQVSDVLDRYLA